MPPFLRSAAHYVYLSALDLAIHVVRYFFFIVAAAFTIGLFSARWLGHDYTLVEVWLPFFLYLGYGIVVALHKVEEKLDSIDSWLVFTWVSKNKGDKDE